MAWRLPSLKALRAFEAAGRQLSFTGAAAELHVTPGAISRQIKTLEAYLRIPLFERNYREVKLTPESKAYLALVTEIFTQMEVETKRLLVAKHGRPLHIVCPLTLMTRWLVPRLGEFHRLYPDQQVRFTTTLSLLRNIPSNSDVDVAFQLGGEKQAGLIRHRVFRSMLVPVCSPRLIAPGTPLNAEQLLTRYTLLHSTARRNAWAIWMAGVGQVEPPNTRSMEFASSTLAYQAAIEGIGIAMGDRELIEADLAAGRLISPIDTTIDSKLDYHLVYATEAEKNKRIQRFRKWIIAEMQRAR